MTVAPRAIVAGFAVFEAVYKAQVDRLCAGGGLDPEAAERWWADLRQAEADGRFFAAITAFVVAGTRPGSSTR